MSGKMKLLLLVLASPLLLGVFNPAAAASQAECAIWLCLPSGFGPSACGAAKDAFRDRISPPDPESPLPPFSECAVQSTGGSNSGGDLSYSQGVSAYVPQQRVCTDHRTRWGWGDRRHCSQWTTVPAHYVDGQWCPFSGRFNDKRHITEVVNGQRMELACRGSARNVRVYQNGQQLGDTYRY